MLTFVRRPVVLLAAVLLTVGGVTAGVILTATAASSSDLDESALLAYETAFVAHARDVGAVIEGGTAEARGMKRAIGTIERGELAGEELHREAEAWEAMIGTSEDRLARVAVPDRLKPAHRLVLEAYATYRELARTLGAIADRPADQHDATLDRAVALGTRGDEQFDAAAAVIQDVRRELGLGPNPDLPDPDGALPEGVEIDDPHELYPEDS